MEVTLSPSRPNVIWCQAKKHGREMSEFLEDKGGQWTTGRVSPCSQTAQQTRLDLFESDYFKVEMSKTKAKRWKVT